MFFTLPFLEKLIQFSKTLLKNYFLKICGLLMRDVKIIRVYIFIRTKTRDRRF